MESYRNHIGPNKIKLKLKEKQKTKQKNNQQNMCNMLIKQLQMNVLKLNTI